MGKMLQNLQEQAMQFRLDINVQKTVEMKINMEKSKKILLRGKGNTENGPVLLLRQHNQ